MDFSVSLAVTTNQAYVKHLTSRVALGSGHCFPNNDPGHCLHPCTLHAAYLQAQAALATARAEAAAEEARARAEQAAARARIERELEAARQQAREQVRCGRRATTALLESGTLARCLPSSAFNVIIVQDVSASLRSLGGGGRRALRSWLTLSF